MRPHSLALLVAGLLVWIGCAGSGALATRTPYPSGRGCTSFGEPPPDIRILLRTPFAAPSVLTMQRPDTFNLEVGYDGTGALSDLIVRGKREGPLEFTSTAGQRPAGSTAAALYDHLRTQFIERAGPGSRAMGMLIAGPSADLQLVPLRWQCPPTFKNRNVIQVFLQSYANSSVPWPRDRQVEVHVVIQRDGKVSEASIYRGSGDDAFDRAVRELSMTMDFEPPLVDGYSIPGEFRYTVTLAAQRETPPPPFRPETVPQ